MMNLLLFSKRAALVAVLLLLTAPAFGSGIGFVPIGPNLAAGVTDTGLREMIELRNLGNGLFAGRPRIPFVSLITVFAPGARDGSLILRELMLSGGQKHLLVTAPSAFNERVVRVTLYLTSPGQGLALFESVNDRWQLREGECIKAETTRTQDNHSPCLLFAVQLTSLGHYQIVHAADEQFPISSAAPNEEATSTPLLGGSVLQGLNTWIAALVLLTLTVVISRMLHNRENARND